MGAFLLTVLLGVGGASASALWLQTSTATMAVTATGNWPGPAIASITCANDSPQKVATLTVNLPRTPATLAPATSTYAALQANGSYGTIYPGPNFSSTSTPGTITLNSLSQIIIDNSPASQLTVRVTVVYSDQTQASANWTLRLDSNNAKIYCV
nr:hypothetical protein [Pseudarthrobacter psychrotolerans]